MKVTMICDMQYGSTGKGMVAAYMAERQYFDTVITANMPNAGHTAYDKMGNEFVHKAMPSAIFHGPRRVMIGPGAVFSPDQLHKEVAHAYLNGHLNNSAIYIHSQAVPLTPGMKAVESASACNKIASTAQGSMVAQVMKMERDPGHKVTAGYKYTPPPEFNIKVVSNSDWIDLISISNNILAEGAQGFSLGIHQDFWPAVTSRDCSPTRFMSDMALPWNALEEVIGVARTYPIRVGNTDQGNSGDCYDDQEEISWSELGVAPETTTVTGRVRRVFTFSDKQFIEAIHQMRPTKVFLNFVNYPHGQTISEQVAKICETNGTVLAWEGHGPRSHDVRAL